MKNLIYIGESQDVNYRIDMHNRLDDWKKQLSAGETLCYSFAPIGTEDRERAEAALIYKHNPLLNTEYVNRFSYEDTGMKLAGKIKFLTEEFIVCKSE